jgi:hypothetical protein
MRIGPVEWAIGATGVGLVVMGVLNVAPWDAFKRRASGAGGAPLPIDTPSTSTPSTTPAGFTGGGADAPGSDPAGMIPIGQSGHKLAPAAYAAFRTWETLFGRTIIVTDTYRDRATQARRHAEDPDRFGSADTSYHVKGRAVDVNLGAVGAVGPHPGAAAGNPTYEKLRSTGISAGWCWPRAGTRGDGKEPWHASHGGCG